LLKTLVLVSLLAASIAGIINRKEKVDAPELSLLRTSTTSALLQHSYEKVEKIFEPDKLVNQYSPIDGHNQKVLRKDLKKVHLALKQLDEKFRGEIAKSLKGHAAYSVSN